VKNVALICMLLGERASKRAAVVSYIGIADWRWPMAGAAAVSHQRVHIVFPVVIFIYSYLCCVNRYLTDFHQIGKNIYKIGTLSRSRVGK